MKKIISIVVLCLLEGCSVVEIREVGKSSIYLDNEYVSLIPSVYFKNLVHDDEAPTNVAGNTYVIHSKDATLSVQRLVNNCSNCIDEKRMVRPVRVEYIPIGTRFKVIGEYLIYSKVPIKGVHESHRFLIQDENRNTAEIDSNLFDDLFIKTVEYSSKTKDLYSNKLRALNKFDKYGQIRYLYCPYLDVISNQDMSKFIKDFELEKEIQVKPGELFCEEGMQLTFLSEESFLTAGYFFTEWQLYGRWFNVAYAEILQESIEDEGSLQEKHQVDLQKHNSFIGKVKNSSYYELNMPEAGIYDLFFSFTSNTRLGFSAFSKETFGTKHRSCTNVDSFEFGCSLKRVSTNRDRKIELKVEHINQPGGVLSSQFEVFVEPGKKQW